MLALKKKREAEKKEKEEAAKNEAKAAAQTPDAAAPTEGGQVSLFGIGGQKKTKKGDGPVTKKSPGEIRIQKGKFRISRPFFLFQPRSDLHHIHSDFRR
jgi:hypothetical protein